MTGHAAPPRDEPAERTERREEQPGDVGPALRVVAWGVRGSIPTPGAHTAGTGGNTSCVEVATGAGRLILDAGTGIRRLGRALPPAARQGTVDVFLTHFHHDHVQGLPFFAPLYERGATVRVHAPPQPGLSLEALVRAPLAAVYFPVPPEGLAAEIQVREAPLDGWEHDGLEVSAIRLRHPSVTYGYRVRSGGRAVAYLPDNELSGGAYPVDPTRAWYERLLAFLDGVDVLIHDAMYDEAELPSRDGWGHSSVEQAVRLAEDAGVVRLILHHHAPDRSDRELAKLLGTARRELAARSSGLKLDLAVEGCRIEIG